MGAFSNWIKSFGHNYHEFWYYWFCRELNWAQIVACCFCFLPVLTFRTWQSLKLLPAARPFFAGDNTAGMKLSTVCGSGKPVRIEITFYSQNDDSQAKHHFKTVLSRHKNILTNNNIKLVREIVYDRWCLSEKKVDGFKIFFSCDNCIRLFQFEYERLHPIHSKINSQPSHATYSIFCLYAPPHSGAEEKNFHMNTQIILNTDSIFFPEIELFLL